MCHELHIILLYERIRNETNKYLDTNHKGIEVRPINEFVFFSDVINDPHFKELLHGSNGGFSWD